MRPALIFCALALVLAACAPPAEPRDASADRRVSRPDSALDAEPMFEDVFFPPTDAVDATTAMDSAPDAESDASAPDARSLDAGSPIDATPDARDAGSDARDGAVDAMCPADGFGGLQWSACGSELCCPVGRCRVDINGRFYCQG